MDLTPSDVRNHSFSRALRGFDAEEVKSYLQTVADELDTLSGERNEMKSRIEKLESKVERYGAVARVLDETIDDTNRSTEELVRDVKAKLDAAKEDAEEVARNAEEQARAIRRKTAQLHERIRQEADEVTEQRRDLARRQQKLMQITAQLTELAGGQIDAEASSSDGAANTSTTPPTLYSGGRPQEEAGQKEKKEKTKQEWIDSLFPNRLGAGDAPQPEREPAQSTSEPTSQESEEPAEGQKSSGSSHFEAIKQDVKSQGGQKQARPSASDDDEDGPSTNELERIWDIFDQTQ
ncbi:hypothetical protein CRI94_14110 [Longibacter salinarum]|uniref:Cell division protein DivIVA n=1 Tax=Longibacter salinarum TaxID=1850348 RepID=A0A2A8CVM7_9BACT|nr:DivIVA domain-containing protein [Longibacter salinarum]PEN12644.1 hypothetical protein CRI94_14110 [Longibacter salinarum]